MANTFITPDIIAKQALASLTETLVMKPLIYTDLTNEFTKAKVGDTINIRKPAKFVAKKFDRAKGIEIQDANEETVPMKLDQYLDVSFTVTSEEAALSIDDFDERLLTPAMQAIALGIDTAILSLRDKVKNSVGDKTNYEWDKPETLIDAGRILDENLVPQADRRAIVGPEMKAYWLNSKTLKQWDKSNSTEALEKAALAENLFGFQTYTSNNVKSASIKEKTGLAFHKNAIAFASAPLDVPAGAYGHVETYQGISLRVVQQYDITKKTSVVSIDTLFGTELLDPKQAVLLKPTAKASTEATPAGNTAAPASNTAAPASNTAA